jgi:hypothetical protein
MTFGKQAVLLVVLLAPSGHGTPRPEAEKKPKLKEPDRVVWGRAVDDLEAGIGFRPGEAQSCQEGGSLTFYICLRNVSDKQVTLSHIEPLFDEFLPTVEDGKGQKRRLVPGPMNLGAGSIVGRTVRPGETIRLGSCWFLVRAPGLKGEAVAQTLVAEPGKYTLYHSGFPIRRNGDDSDKYTGPTGRVEFTILAAPATR